MLKARRILYRLALDTVLLSSLPLHQFLSIFIQHPVEGGEFSAFLRRLVKAFATPGSCAAWPLADTDISGQPIGPIFKCQAVGPCKMRPTDFLETFGNHQIQSQAAETAKASPYGRITGFMLEYFRLDILFRNFTQNHRFLPS